MLAVALHAASLGAQEPDSARRPVSTAEDSARVERARADSVRRGRLPAGRPRRPTTAAATATLPDSLLRPPISPRRAFVYSLLLPGQGQTSLRRRKAAALFGAIEVGSIFMLLKSQNDLRVARRHVADSVFIRSDPPLPGTTDSVRVYQQDPLAARVRARRLHVEDWVATLIFNHLFAGADAFVAAQLWDLPAQVSFRPAPRGISANVSVTW